MSRRVGVAGRRTVTTMLLVLATAALPAQATGTATISGRVTDQAGRGVPGVEVYLWPGYPCAPPQRQLGYQGALTYTGQDGRYAQTVDTSFGLGYLANFTPPDGSGLLPQLYRDGSEDGMPFACGATSIAPVDDGQTITGIDVRLHEAPAPPPPPRPVDPIPVTVAVASPASARGRVVLSLHCVDRVRCVGGIALRARGRRIGSTTYSVGPGITDRRGVVLNRTGRRLLARAPQGLRTGFAILPTLADGPTTSVGTIRRR